MSKRFDAISIEEENRASREFHSVPSKGRKDQVMAKALKEVVLVGADDEFLEDLPKFERIQKRARR